MTYNPAKYHRRSIRLNGHDYSQPGAYFITMCTKNRACFFCEIIDGKNVMNDVGKMARQCWMDIPIHFPHAQLDEFVIMPNHIHGIIILHDSGIVGANNYSPLRVNPLDDRNCNGTSKTIGSIVRGFKIGVTKWIRTNIGTHELWQRNYWEHVIRDDNELFRIRQYIQKNPANWKHDALNGLNENIVAESPAPYGEEPWMT
jgi:REP element-mobilizing transposase RayT